METRGIMYSKSTTLDNITLMDIALNPTCFIKLAIPTLVYWGYPLASSTWSPNGPYVHLILSSTSLGSHVVLGTWMVWPPFFQRTPLGKGSFLHPFYFLNFFSQVGFCDPLIWDVFFPSQTYFFMLTFVEEGSLSSVHLY